MQRALYLSLLWFLSFSCFSQRYGTPVLRYYSPAEYKGFAQNWCAAQDDRGVMYFGNGKGILEYNGKTWRRFPTEQRTTVLCMVKGNDGRVYVGGENEIGYLAPDSSGLMQFVSLNNKISEKENKFTYVWAVHNTNEGICFVTGEKIICWNGQTMSYYPPQKSFFTSFCVNGSLYVIGTDEGLFKLENKELKFIPGTEELYEASVRYIGAAGNDIFIASRKGFYTYGAGGLKKIPSAIEPLMKERGLYKGATLPDGNFALGTMGGGVMIVNAEGELLETIDESKGLEGKSVYACFVDRENELWLAQENGISRVAYSTPIRILDTRHGLHGIIRTVTKTREGFFAATFQGLFKLNSDGTFAVQNGINTGANVTIPYRDNSLLLCAGEIGTIQIKGDKNIPVNPDPYVLSMSVSRKDSAYVIAGSVDKVYVLKNENGNWSTVTTIDSLGDEINTIAQVKDTYWLTTTNKGKVFQLSFEDNTYTKYKLDTYDSLHGIPPGLVEAYEHNNKLYLGSDKGVLVFDESRRKFVSDNSLWNIAGMDPPGYAYLLKVDQNKDHWALTNKGFGYFSNGKFFNSPFRRIGFSDYYAIHTEADGSAWLGGTNGIAVYSPNTQKAYTTSYNALITRVVHGKDTLFSGAFYTAGGVVSLEQNAAYKYIFPFKENSLLFEYASPFFDAEEALYFSFKLEGFDADWSQWVKETRKEYTNLPEGTYVFCVKAKNIYEQESTVAKFEFTVLTPWYRSWWAYVLYVLGSVLLIYLVIKIQTARLKRENEKLEKLVKERTAEVVKQKNEIEEQNQKLQLAYDEIGEKQKEILDSIHYAKRIQRSLLPTEKYLERALNELKKK